MFDPKSRKQYLAEISALVSNWPSADAAALEGHLKKSLEDVTHLTEYQDEKASRIMTAMAFVGALVAAVHALGLQLVFPSSGTLVICFNVCFWAFYMLAVIGSAYVIYGIKPRYNMPKDSGPRPLSLVFAPEIDRVTGTAWAGEWVGKTPADLDAQSAKCLVSEIKLIAQKAVLKTATLSLATSYYMWSLWLLILGIFILGIGIVNKAMPAAHAHVVIVFDADNTLWDTNALYARAQENLVTGVEQLAGKNVTGDRVAYLRRFDEEIAHSHQQGFRYPIHLLIEKMYQDLSGQATTPIEKTQTAFRQLEKEYLGVIAGAPRLFPGVKEALVTLSSKGHRLILLSEGDPDLVQERLDKNGIRDYFHEVIVTRKTPEVFAQLRKTHSAGDQTLFVSVGDRLDVDMAMANKAGYRTIHVPGGFRPFGSKIADIKVDRSVVSLNEIPSLVESFR